MPPILEARDLRKEYPGKLALKNLNLQLQPDAVFCLLSQNGVGKSIAINLFLGFIAPTAGAASIRVLRYGRWLGVK